MLNGRNSFPTAFLSPTYVRTAGDIFDVHVCRIIHDGTTVAFFPFQYKTSLHRMIRVGERVGAHLCDYFGVVARDGFQISPNELLRLSKLNAILFSNLDESQTAYGLVGEHFEVGLRTEIPAGEVVLPMSGPRSDRKLANDTRRRRAHLIDRFGPIRFTLREEYSRVRLDALILEKRAQYRRTGAIDALAVPATRELLHKLAQTSDSNCSGIFSSLYAGDTWVAFHFGLVSQGTLHYWFPVYNSSLGQYSPGRLLLTEIIAQCSAHGLNCIDRGVGDTIAKRDFATSEHRFSRGLWHLSRGRALFYRAGLAMTWRVSRLRQNGNARI